jgi:hypothetical protein
MQVAAGGEHGRVLDGRGDDVVALAEAGERDARDREVVGLAPAAVAPSACALEGFPKSRSRYWRIDSSTAGAIGVVALWSR